MKYINLKKYHINKIFENKQQSLKQYPEYVDFIEYLSEIITNKNYIFDVMQIFINGDYITKIETN